MVNDRSDGLLLRQVCSIEADAPLANPLFRPPGKKRKHARYCLAIPVSS
jgi:hypothetical protein